MTSTRGKAGVILLLVLILWDGCAELVWMRRVLGPDTVLERNTLHDSHTQGLDKPSKEVDVSQEYLDQRNEKLWAY